MDLVSVIVPAYNADRFLRSAVESVLNQTHQRIELLVINDGSTDRTAEILASYGAAIRVINQSNQGVAAACNTGVAASQGKWIAFLDADDEWLPEKIETQLRECGRARISYTDCVCFGAGLDEEILRSTFEPPHSGRVLEHLVVANFITKSSVMMHRDLYVEHGGFPETYAAVEDWPLWLAVCATNELAYCAKPLVRYRVHRKSKSMQCRRTLADHKRIIAEAFARGGVAAELPGLRTRALRSSYVIHSHYAAEMGDWVLAMRCALSALCIDPLEAQMWKRLVKSALIPLGVKY